jgi:hypothetical protein
VSSSLQVIVKFRHFVFDGYCTLNIFLLYYDINVEYFFSAYFFLYLLYTTDFTGYPPVVLLDILIKFLKCFRYFVLAMSQK